MKKIYPPILLSIFLLFFYYLKVNNTSEKYDKKHIPIEYIDKKNKRKELKNKRKEWIENMHRSHPDDDWKLMDKINRSNNVKQVIKLRESILNEQRIPINYREEISRDIEGQ